MKRSIDNVDGASTSSSKKPHVEDNEDGNGDINPGQSFLLVNQNKALNLELQTYKRSIAEARKELDLMRRKSREMESLVSLIQRAWGQLDIDAALLLDSLGDLDGHLPPEDNSDLLFYVLNAKVKNTLFDPTKFNNIPMFNVDQWSNVIEIEKAKKLAEDSIGEEATALEVGNVEAVFANLDQHLEEHVSFTLNLLEKVCNAINNETGTLLPSANPELVQKLSSAKENQSKLMIYKDAITKLRLEIIQLHSKLFIIENEKKRVEKRFDKAQFTIKELEETMSNQKIYGLVPSDPSDPTNTSSSSEATSALTTVQHSQIKELLEQIKILERQLSESESAKAQVEMTLTERLARPLPQTEAQVADMRKAMEELRQQFKQRVSTLMTENENLQGKIKDLQLALNQIETITTTKIKDIITLTEKEVTNYKQEKLQLESEIVQLKSDVVGMQEMKQQLNEFLTIDDSKNKKINTLENQLRTLQESNTIFNQHLDSARQREKQLEAVVAQIKSSKSSSKDHIPSSSSSSSTSANNNIDITQDILKTNPLQFTSDQIPFILTLQKKYHDLEQEYQHCNNSINDLILEIEAISTSESQSRSQSESLLKQVVEYQSMQRAALDENVQLANQLEHYKAQQKEIDGKVENIKLLMIQQDQLLSQLRSEEMNLKVELIELKKARKDLQEGKHREEEKINELEKVNQDIGHSLQAALKRNQELQSRCNELSKLCEKERTSRMDKERESKQKTKKESASTSNNGADGSASMSNEDQAMLEMTLGMLRCSVCKDRFKNVAITRCFHLFCRECIEENLRNRSRKCPACGEKFGQDDVTNIYFTN